jgi:RecB family exonuclease
MEELSGRRPAQEDGGVRYNLAWGPPLTAHPLFVAGTLPLVLGEQADPVGALAALLRSPFSDPSRFDGFEETLSRLWARGERVPATRAVQEVARRFPSLAALGDFLPGKLAPVSRWVQRLRTLWRALGFPWKGGSPLVRDLNAAAFAQLDDALRSLERSCGQARTDAAGALAWLTALCEGQKVAEPGAETAGIQLLSAADAFGHAFDAVWCVGAHGDALPRATGAQPLLSPAESLALSGGDPQRRAWEESLALLGSLLSSCEDPARVAFSRPKSEADGQRPYSPSPLLKDRFRAESPDEAEVFDVWGAERPRWLAAPWLAAASRGLAEPAPAPAADEPALPPLRSPLSVTALDRLLKCPFQYFAARELGLEPPPEAAEGVSPLTRGSVVHEILGAFTSALGESLPDWPERMEEAWTLLRATARERLSAEGGPYWSAEAVRLLGEDAAGAKGVLRAWLEAERERALAGWRIEPPAEKGERPFEGLELGGCGVRLEGRVDRVDRNEALGARAVWDYKTGEPPAPAQVLRDLSEGQLPAYLLALQAGRVDPEVDGRPVPWTGGLEAGYITLKKASEVALKPLPITKYHPNAEAFLEAWVDHAQERLKGPLEGRFPPDPDPPAALPGQARTACEHCPYGPLCGYFDWTRAARPGSEEDNE